MEATMSKVACATAAVLIFLAVTIPAGAQIPVDPSRDPRYNPSINPNFNPLINPNYNPLINPKHNPMAPAQPFYTPEGKPRVLYGVSDGKGGTNYFDGTGNWRGFSPRP
jgi:hypothetical protein